ncbi:uncharacterized protein BDV17DRAFT_144113 [Aspergillus undulatus]|uniref:uncharacterized protein n=1 Tax=Aspergillus undulatus TaxID=1810928 RepID=UPI003CCDBD72
MTVRRSLDREACSFLFLTRRFLIQISAKCDGRGRSRRGQASRQAVGFNPFTSCAGLASEREPELSMLDSRRSGNALRHAGSLRTLLRKYPKVPDILAAPFFVHSMRFETQLLVCRSSLVTRSDRQGASPQTKELSNPARSGDYLSIRYHNLDKCDYRRGILWLVKSRLTWMPSFHRSYI